MNDSKEKLLSALLAEDARLPDNAPDQELLDQISTEIEAADKVIPLPFWKKPEFHASIAACVVVGLILTGAGLWQIPLGSPKDDFIEAGPFQVYVEEGSKLKSKDASRDVSDLNAIREHAPVASAPMEQPAQTAAAAIDDETPLIVMKSSGSLTAQPVKKREANKIKAQINALYGKSGDELIEAAADLNIIESRVPLLYEKLVTSKKSVDSLEVSGVDENDPKLVEARKVYEIVKKDTDVAVKELEETLRSRLELFEAELEPHLVAHDGLALFHRLSNAHHEDPSFKSPAETPLSTFSIHNKGDSYAQLKNTIYRGNPIKPDSVHIEELINAFPYDYAAPSGDHAFAVHAETAACPWNTETRLVKIGLKGKDASAIIAKHVKIQVEFNPAEVAEYRLLGYANRQLKDEDYDRVDAGEIGAGHTVTAIYEFIPGKARPAVDQLKYANPVDLKKGETRRPSAKKTADEDAELLTVKLRYKKPEGSKSTLMEHAVKESGKSFSSASADFRFASSVALYGMLLRNTEHTGGADFSTVKNIVKASLKEDPLRKEFLELVEKTPR